MRDNAAPSRNADPGRDSPAEAADVANSAASEQAGFPVSPATQKLRFVLATRLGLLAVGVGLASMFVTVPIVGAAGLVLMLIGAILLGIGLWGRSVLVAGMVLTVAVALTAAGPWRPFLYDRLFSWLTTTAIPFLEDRWLRNRGERTIQTGETNPGGL